MLCTQTVSRVCDSQAQMSLWRPIKHCTRDAREKLITWGKQSRLLKTKWLPSQRAGGSAREAVGGSGFGDGWGNMNASLCY